ncbi:dihydrodipicolinate synthase [Caballeronia choica]|uniref:Dihydrodipicolinate synthase n=1 Tax=Caballeronia choica TaxID=326476 RepID=A0A158KKQ7_9BURK|nr:dihydrodipicolinate synthase family protein [Caballeronia choica]SAL81575.1 dihydrodipicolinate synthase [Caballeronia choica]
MYSSIWLPIVTPFRNGQVDVDALQRLADHYLRTEISGFVALGTTGEAALLDPHERMTVLHALFETVGTRLPIVIGVGGMNTSEMIRDMQQFDHWDSGGYLVSAPAYICPDQRGIQWHFEEIAHATDRPVVLYDVPHRTGVPILPDTVRRLVECSNIVAIKACVGEHFRALGALPISMLCGSDELFVDCLEAGGTGEFWRVRICSPMTSSTSRRVSPQDESTRHARTSNAWRRPSS